MENHYETQRRKRTHIRLCFLSFAKSFCTAPLLHCFAVTEKECDALWYLIHSTHSSLSRLVWLAVRVAMIVCITWGFVDCDCIVQGVGSGLSQKTGHYVFCIMWILCYSVMCAPRVCAERVVPVGQVIAHCPTRCCHARRHASTHFTLQWIEPSPRLTGG